MSGNAKKSNGIAIVRPPAGWRRLLVLGPGLVWAASSIGVAELVFATRAGAIFGFLLIWVPLMSLFFKYFITELMGRYTIASGRDVIWGFSRMETKIGPVRLPKGWIIWIFWAFFIASVAGMSGIALTVGSAVFGMYPQVPYEAYAVGALILVGVFLFVGSYKGLEYGARVLIAAMIFFAFYSVVRESPDAGEMARGLIPNVPEGSLRELIPLLGWTGAGAMGTVWYSLWTKAAGRGTVDPTKPLTDADVTSVRGWIGVNRLDLLINMILTAILTVGFLLAGAAILHPLGVVPEGESMGFTLSAIAGTFYGAQGRVIFLIGVFATLFSTLLADIDGLCRVASGALSARPGTGKSTRFYYLVFLAVYIVTAGIFVTIISAPIILLQLTAVIDTILLPVVGIMGISLCTKQLPDAFRPGRVFVGFSYASVVFFVIFIVLFFAAVIGGVNFSL